MKDRDRTYKNVKELFDNSAYDVKYYHADVRGDDGDDAGYVVSVCTLEDKVYLFAIFVSYNLGINSIHLPGIQEGGDLEKHMCVEFNSTEEAYKYIDKLCDILDKHAEAIQEWQIYNPDEEELKDFSDAFDIENDLTLCTFLDTMAFPYSEYGDKEGYILRNRLSKEQLDAKKTEFINKLIDLCVENDMTCFGPKNAEKSEWSSAIVNMFNNSVTFN